MKKFIVLFFLLFGLFLGAQDKNTVSTYVSYRYNAIPDFIFKPFFEEFQSVDGHSFSLQASFKTGNFAYTLDLDMMNLAAEEGFWRQKEKAPDYLVIDTTYLNLGVNFEWFFNFTPKFEMVSSLGVGLGIFLGEITKYKTAGYTNTPKLFKKDDLKPPVFAHLLISLGFQYEVYKIQEKNPVFFRVNFGFKNSFFAGTSIGYQF